LRAAGAEVAGARRNGVEPGTADLVGQGSCLEREQLTLDGFLALLQFGLNGRNLVLQRGARRERS
jgi:hypothetical protein